MCQVSNHPYSLLSAPAHIHSPEKNPAGPTDNDENEARTIIEKKSVINLLEAFAVAVKHYLRGEDGIFYADLYYLVKHLPAYSLPKGLPSTGDLSDPLASPPLQRGAAADAPSPPTSPHLERFASQASGLSKRTPGTEEEEQQLPIPVTSPTKKASFLQPPPSARNAKPARPRLGSMGEKSRTSLGGHSNVEAYLFPARMPPKYSIFDVFPFSLLVKALTKKGKNVKGKKAARMRAKMRKGGTTQNLPLEISLYLVSRFMHSLKLTHLPSSHWLSTDERVGSARARISLHCKTGKCVMCQQRVEYPLPPSRYHRLTAVVLSLFTIRLAVSLFESARRRADGIRKDLDHTYSLLVSSLIMILQRLGLS